MEKDTLKDDLEDFQLCVDAEREQRKQSQADLEFAKLNKQWDEDAISQRANEGRPCLTINRLPSFTKQVTNDARMNRASIAVKPVGGGADKATADIQSDLIRNIETQSQANVVYDTAFDFAVNGGVGYFRINVDYTDEDAWDQDIFLERIPNPFSVYGDYESKEMTSIDWNRAFVTDFYSKSAFEARWGKDKKASSFEVGSGDYDQNWFEDKRIRVAERWLREQVAVKLLRLSDGAIMFADEWEKNQEFFLAQGLTVEGTRDTKSYKVKQRIITGTDVLEESDWLGKYIPIVPMYGEEANVNGKRSFFSLIHRAKDSQRMFNYWRTAATELVALAPKAPWIGPVGMFATDAAKWGTANHQSHSTIEYDVVPEQPAAFPQRTPFAGVPAGALQEALNASDDMKAIMGIYDASLGARSNETSGKAIIARQREGDTSTFDFISNRNIAVEHGGRIILDLIPKLYTAERILRCVQEDGSTYTVPVNQPVAPKQEIERLRNMAMGPQMPAMPQPGMMQGQPMPGAMPQEPEQQQDGPPQYEPIPPELEQQLTPELAEKLKAVTKIFDLTTGKYDVMVTAGPGFTTRREEAATQMMEFIRVFPQAAPLIGDLLAKNLDWPGAEQVADRLRAMLPPQAAGKVNPMVMQLQQMLQQQDAQAKQAIAQLQQEIAKLGQQVQDKRAEHAIKAQELQIKGFEAETRRAEVLKPEAPQAPEQVDPVKVAELRIKAEELRLQAEEIELSKRDKSVSEYTAETERLKLLAERLPPEAFQMLIMKTTGEAMSTTLESAEDNPEAAMCGHMVGSMPMAEPAPEMGGMQDMPMDQQTMPPDGMAQ
jgi:hypothetical protein